MGARLPPRGASTAGQVLAGIAVASAVVLVPAAVICAAFFYARAHVPWVHAHPVLCGTVLVFALALLPAVPGRLAAYRLRRRYRQVTAGSERARQAWLARGGH